MSGPLVEIAGSGAKAPPMMGCIQVAMSDQGRADTLCGLLARSAGVPVRRVERPDFESACVVVFDAARFAQCAGQLQYPERVVLITPNDAGHLGAAWDAGINSVLSDQDPLNTVVLAVLATCLRTGAARRKGTGDRGSGIVPAGGADGGGRRPEPLSDEEPGLTRTD